MALKDTTKAVTRSWISTVHILLSHVTVSVATTSGHKTTYFKMNVLQNEITVCRNPFRGL